MKLWNIQSLRAYGALAVAFYHTEFTLGIGLDRPIGSFGVSIFFVISGFIMAMICGSNPRHFLVRRIARIVPLYWLLTVAVFLVASLAPRLLGGTDASGVALLKSLFFIPYLSHGAFFPILFLGWSLNYEMYFYLLIGVALVIHRRHAALLAAATMVAVLLLLQALGVSGAARFYGHPIVLEFVLGIVCYYGFRAIPRGRILANRMLIICTLAAAGITMIFAAITTIGPLNAIIVGCTSTILVFCAVLLDKVGISVRWPTLILLGDASYVIYLVHPYCEEVLNKIVAQRFPVLNTRTLIGMPVALGITIVVSILLYRLIDNPLHLFFRNLLSKSGKATRVSPAIQVASD